MKMKRDERLFSPEELMPENYKRRIREIVAQPELSIDEKTHLIFEAFRTDVLPKLTRHNKP